MIDNVTFPVDLAPLYSSVKNVDRVDLVLDVYDTLTRFFNTFVSPILIKLISDGGISSYKIGLDDEDDAIVYNLLNRAFKRVDQEEILSQRTLDRLGIGRAELVRSLKVIAAVMVEACLETCVDVLQEEASEKRLRLDCVMELAATRDISARGELPTMIHLEAEYKLDSIGKIERY